LTTDNKIGLGTSSPTQPIDFRGSCIQVITANYNGLDAGMRFGYMYDALIIDPLRNNNGYIGYNNAWNQIKSYNLLASYATFTNLYYYNITHYSDENIKENIKDIKDPIGVVSKLHGVMYDIRNDFFKNKGILAKNDMKPNKNEIGFIAQEVQKILPQAVSYDSSTNLYGVNYVCIIPLLIEAVKQQQKEIETLKNTNSDNLKSAKDNSNEANSMTVPIEIGKAALLKQNSPNPFNKETTISYYLPESINNATIYIYNMQGYQIKSIPIFSKGNGSIQINASELQAGIYFYTLIIDGKEIDTKKMILTE
jgi:hypothetical protein